MVFRRFVTAGLGCALLAPALLVCMPNTRANAIEITLAELEQPAKKGSVWHWVVTINPAPYGYLVNWSVGGYEGFQVDDPIVLIPESSEAVVGIYKGVISVYTYDDAGNPTGQATFNVAVYVYNVTPISNTCDPFTIELPKLDTADLTSAINEASSAAATLDNMANSVGNDL